MASSEHSSRLPLRNLVVTRVQKTELQVDLPPLQQEEVSASSTARYLEAEMTDTTDHKITATVPDKVQEFEVHSAPPPCLRPSRPPPPLEPAANQGRAATVTRLGIILNKDGREAPDMLRYRGASDSDDRKRPRTEMLHLRTTSDTLAVTESQLTGGCVRALVAFARSRAAESSKQW